MAKPTVMPLIAFRMPAERQQECRQIAAQRGLNVSEFIRLAVDRELAVTKRGKPPRQAKGNGAIVIRQESDGAASATSL